MSVGEGMTAPALPLYGDSLGASYKQLGFLMTGYSVAYALMTVIAGKVSDHIGRKGILLISIFLSIVASTGYFLSATPVVLLMFRTLEGASRGILWPISEAIVADNTTSSVRDKAMGRFTAAYGAGVTLGTLLGGYVTQYISLTAVFPVYPILGIIVFATSLLGITEASPDEQCHGKALGKLDVANFKREIKKIWPLCYVGFAYAGFLYSLWALLSKVADSFGVSSVNIGVIFALFWGSRMIAFMLCGNIAAVLGRKRVLVFGVLLCALSAGTLLTAQNFTLLAMAAACGGAGTGLTFPLSITLVSNQASPAYRGFAIGFLEFCMGIGMITQTALSGIIGEAGGVQSTYLFTFAVIMVAIPIALFFIHDEAALDTFPSNQ